VEVCAQSCLQHSLNHEQEEDTALAVMKSADAGEGL
jgi:hypothetical protein